MINPRLAFTEWSQWSVVWGGWDTNTPSFSLPAQQKGVPARGWRSSTHWFWCRLYNTYTTPNTWYCSYSQGRLISTHVSFAHRRDQNESWLRSQIGSDGPNGSPGSACSNAPNDTEVRKTHLKPFIRWPKKTQPMFFGMSALEMTLKQTHFYKARLKLVLFSATLCPLSHSAPFFVTLYSCMFIVQRPTRGKGGRDLYLPRFSLEQE